ncbi:MAG TPA: ammonia-forming cytochrome c nitrite reductase subunit c552, partial [Bdellovibrionota bacterium]|nr:ammonia-forming cytochrome c nitrite reductase subunit c552 [Bdellovibrionota bacterium]
MTDEIQKNRFRLTPKRLLIALLGTAIVTFIVTYLLISIFRHKTEAQNPYLRFVEVKQATTNPDFWGLNWAREYDQYKRTVEVSKTNFGGGDASPAQKSEVFPFLPRMFAGYAFSLDYRDRRG